MNVLIDGTKPLDREILRDVTGSDVSRWVAQHFIVHGNVIRPMSAVARIELNYEEPSK